MTVNVGYIPVDNLELVWDTVLPLLSSAVERQDDTPLSEVVGEICSGSMLLWLVDVDHVPTLVLTTKIIDRHSHSTLAIEWVGGSQMKDVIDVALETLEDYALKVGCTSLEGQGRMGWGRTLKEYGWETKHIVYRKELRHGQQNEGDEPDV